MLIPSPCVTDSRTLILWSQDPVPSFVSFPGIPFPYGINILVATLFIFSRACDSWRLCWGLPKQVDPSLCLLFVYWVFICFYVYILYVCLHVYFLLAYHVYFCLHIMHLDYIMGPRGGHIFFCFVLHVGVFEVKGPLPRPSDT